MVRLRHPVPIWVWLGVLSSATGVASADVIPNAFMVQCSGSHPCKTAASAVEDMGGKLRRVIDSEGIMNAVSFYLPEPSSSGLGSRAAMIARLNDIDGVNDLFPLYTIDMEPEPAAVEQPYDSLKSGSATGKQPSLLGRRGQEGSVVGDWSHEFTQIRDLHAEGITGAGVSIGIVDTGVNYNLSVLGGCMGPGCRVTKGLSFDVEGEPVADPVDSHGHGTKVAAVAAGYSESDGFVGAAPKATILAYRATNRYGHATLDSVMAAYTQAYDDGAHIIVNSLGSGVRGKVNPADTKVADLISRITKKGVLCIIAAGNDKNMGLFNLVGRRTVHDALIVNSFRRKREGSYRTGVDDRPESGATVSFTYRSDSHRNSLADQVSRLHDVDSDYGDKPEDALLPDDVSPSNSGQFCQIQPGLNSDSRDFQYTKDLVGAVGLIRLSPETRNCSFGSRVENAAARGARHLLIWHDRPRPIMEEGEATIRALPPVLGYDLFVGIVDPEVGRDMARALADGKIVSVWPNNEIRDKTALESLSAAFGPTASMDIKPDLGAPGEYVRVPMVSGSYGSASGTSFSAPLAAGIAALIIEARRIDRDPVLLRSLLMSTAEPQRSWYGPITAAFQGAGMVKAWEAAHASTLVTPSSLAFRDIDSRPASISLRITNTAESEVSYRLSAVAASTLYAFGPDAVVLGKVEASSYVEGAAASIQLSLNSLELAGGDSATIEVSASDPPGLDSRRLPVWSGWIAIDGSNGENLTVPYLGVAAAVQSSPVMQGDQLSTWLYFRNGPNGLDVEANATYIFPSPNSGDGPTSDSTTAMPRPKDAVDIESVLLEIQLLRDWSLLRVDIVPLDLCPPTLSTTGSGAQSETVRACVPDSMTTDFAGLKTIGHPPGGDLKWQPRGHVALHWNGTMAGKGFAPPGRYKIVALAARTIGDPTTPSDWHSLETPEFSILYRQNLSNGTETVGEGQAPVAGSS